MIEWIRSHEPFSTLNLIKWFFTPYKKCDFSAVGVTKTSDNNYTFHIYNSPHQRNQTNSISLSLANPSPLYSASLPTSCFRNKLSRSKTEREARSHSKILCSQSHCGSDRQESVGLGSCFMPHDTGTKLFWALSSLTTSLSSQKFLRWQPPDLRLGGRLSGKKEGCEQTDTSKGA